jgi:hypothetical protein
MLSICTSGVSEVTPLILSGTCLAFLLLVIHACPPLILATALSNAVTKRAVTAFTVYGLEDVPTLSRGWQEFPRRFPREAVKR